MPNSGDLFDQHKLPNQQSEYVPLADRMRPRSLDEVVGQDQKSLQAIVASGHLPSLIFWGPPGSGKTSIARLLAGTRPFFQISAVLAGVQELRGVIQKAKTHPGAVVFIDEIHRWNKAQQDALLPHIEDGTLTLVGATTENPSFEVISPLMSRCKLIVLRSLSHEALKAIIQRALTDMERGLGSKKVTIQDDAWDALIMMSSGDARQALNMLEIVAHVSPAIDLKLLTEVFEKKSLRYDKKGEHHYDTISAFIKSMRGSDPDAAIYYLARMYESGEDPRFLARRMIIFASEDIGNADPRALQVAVSAAEAFERVGQAEGWIPLSQAAVYLATAPKSNASYMAYKNAKGDVEAKGELPVPMHLRNAPTQMMEHLGYGKGYEYAHDQQNAHVSHHHLPDELKGKTYYQPTDRGYEKMIQERLKSGRLATAPRGILPGHGNSV